jgi:hypothetical protein
MQTAACKELNKSSFTGNNKHHAQDLSCSSFQPPITTCECLNPLLNAFCKLKKNANTTDLNSTNAAAQIRGKFD